MPQTAYLDAKIGVDPSENDPRKECLPGAPLGPLGEDAVHRALLDHAGLDLLVDAGAGFAAVVRRNRLAARARAVA